MEGIRLKNTMMQYNYEQIEEFLNTIPQFTELNGLERAGKLLEALGNPQKGLKVIHVAGSNGKGSVCVYIDEILRANGYHTGLFVSPHLVDIRERIRTDGRLIDRQELVKAFERVSEAAKKLLAEGIRLAYFDYFFGMAMCIFMEKNVDIVILETGIGGKLDATNVIEKPLLSVITTVSKEHTAVLGDTLEKIAAEKAGIIKSGVPVVYSAKEADVIKVIEEIARAKGAFPAVGVKPEMYQIYKNTGNCIDFSLHNGYYKNECFSLATGAVYQAENCSIALTAVKVLQERGLLKLDEGKIKQAVYNMHWEGRMEEVLSGVYLDGAHNPEGIESFIRSAQAICGEKKAVLLFSVVKDKNFENMIRSLSESELFDCFIVTELNSSRRLDGENIKELFAKYTNADVYETDSLSEAFSMGRAKQKETGGILLCTGSLYLVGEIKELLLI